MHKIEAFISRVVDWMSKGLAALLVLLVLNVVFDVMMRYVFRASSVGMQELEWHLFSIIFLFGIGVGLKHEAHVRVDFLFDRMRAKNRALINIWGTLLMLLPLALLIFFDSFGFVQDAYVSNEISEDPGGLPYRWIIKSMIPLSFAFLIFSAVGYVLKNIQLYREAR